MATRPQNIGIKAIEIYFPQQVSLVAWTVFQMSADTIRSVLSKLSSRSSMALLLENTQLASVRHE